jgi:hypothetical protein
MIAGSLRCYLPETARDHESAPREGSGRGALGLV